METTKKREYTFNIIENCYLDWNLISGEFTHDYLYSTLKNNEIKDKYNLTRGEFNECKERVHNKYGLTRRPHFRDRNGGSKYYFKASYGFVIQKKIEHVNTYIGTVKTELLAKKIVRLCKEADWDIETCRMICNDLKASA